jgi:large subunit ribosomal protein L23
MTQEFNSNYFDVLKRPLLTEKGQDMRDEQGKYLFEVSASANKVEVARAVEKLFGVRVAKVNTQWIRGKQKRVGRNIGKRANWKKAVVTLRAGDVIDFFEGA